MATCIRGCAGKAGTEPSGETAKTGREDHEKAG